MVRHRYRRSRGWGSVTRLARGRIAGCSSMESVLSFPTFGFPVRIQGWPESIDGANLGPSVGSSYSRLDRSRPSLLAAIRLLSDTRSGFSSVSREAASLQCRLATVAAIHLRTVSVHITGAIRCPWVAYAERRGTLSDCQQPPPTEPGLEERTLEPGVTIAEERVVERNRAIDDPHWMQ